MGGLGTIDCSETGSSGFLLLPDSSLTELSGLDWRANNDSVDTERLYTEEVTVGAPKDPLEGGWLRMLVVRSGLNGSVTSGIGASGEGSRLACDKLSCGAWSASLKAG